MNNNRDRKPRDAARSEPSVDARRRGALKGLLAGGTAAGVAATGLPGTWTRPVVQSVILPAHAQTSTVEPEVPADGAFNIPDVLQTGGLLDWLLPRAYAQFTCPLTDGCVNLVDGEATVHVYDGCCCYTGNGQLGQTIDDFTDVDNCNPGCALPSIRPIEVLGPDGSRILKISIDGGDPIDCDEITDCSCSSLI